MHNLYTAHARCSGTDKQALLRIPDGRFVRDRNVRTRSDKHSPRLARSDAERPAPRRTDGNSASAMPSPEENIFDALFIFWNNASFPQSAFMTNIFYFQDKINRKIPRKGRPIRQKALFPSASQPARYGIRFGKRATKRPPAHVRRPSISIRRNDQPKCPFRSRYSAICTAFSAAPLRIWSLTHQNVSEFGSARSLRIRPTYTASTPAKGSGIG